MFGFLRFIAEVLLTYWKALLFKYRNSGSLCSQEGASRSVKEERKSPAEARRGSEMTTIISTSKKKKSNLQLFLNHQLFSVLAECYSQPQPQFKVVFQRSKCKCPRWGLIGMTENERSSWHQERADLKKGWVSLPCSLLWTCWSSDTFRAGVLEEIHLSC